MEVIDFCNKWCPMAIRWVEFSRIDNEVTVDCYLEENECPFKNVDFSKVKEYNWDERTNTRNNE